MEKGGAFENEKYAIFRRTWWGSTRAVALHHERRCQRSLLCIGTIEPPMSDKCDKGWHSFHFAALSILPEMWQYSNNLHMIPFDSMYLRTSRGAKGSHYSQKR